MLQQTQWKDRIVCDNWCHLHPGVWQPSGKGPRASTARNRAWHRSHLQIKTQWTVDGGSTDQVSTSQWLCGNKHLLSWKLPVTSYQIKNEHWKVCRVKILQRRVLAASQSWRSSAFCTCGRPAQWYKILSWSHKMHFEEQPVGSWKCACQNLISNTVPNNVSCSMI